MGSLVLTGPEIRLSGANDHETSSTLPRRDLEQLHPDWNSLGEAARLNEESERAAVYSQPESALSAATGTASPSKHISFVTQTQAARLHRRLTTLSTLIVMAIFGVAALLMASQRADDLAASERARDNLAQVLAEQTSRTIQPVDLTLRELQARLEMAQPEAPTSTSNAGTRATNDLLVERAKGLPQVDALMIVGADGSMVNLSRAFPVAPMNVTGREYFQYLSKHDDHALFVSAPARTVMAGRWVVFLGRRINDARGAFAGIVLAGVTLSYLEDFYRVVTPKNGSITVLRRDGVLLVRYPPAEDQIGTWLAADSPWYKLLITGGGSYASPGYVDGVRRLVSIRPLRDFPLVIDITTTEAEVLTIWHRQAAWLLAGASAASACVMFLLRIFGAQYNRLARQNAQLETGRQRFDAVLDNMSQGLTLFDEDQKLVVCNRRFAEIYNLTPDQTLPGTTLSDIISYRINNKSFPDMTPAAYLARRDQYGSALTNYAVTDEFRDGRTVSMHYQPLPGGGWVVTHEEITERRRAEAALAFMARHDALTGLPNRTLFQERLDTALAQTRRSGQCALLCLDLDRFKVINDTLGHPVGDGLLRTVAAKLSGIVREGDTVARLGGDEFAIILPGLKSPDLAATLAERIITATSEPFEVDGHRIMTSTSIGIAISPKDGILSDALMKSADVALYLAKAENRGTCRFFEPEIDSYIQRRRSIELDLRNALPAEDFVLHYQPVLDLGTGRVTGFEALIRWQHPVKGMVSPADFIPVAEETGLIVPIGAWALKKACQEAAGWPDHIDIAVNLSPVQFRRGQLRDTVQEALTASGLAPNRLELEITESTLLENSSDRLVMLQQIRELGVSIALDDFGTGYSSLSYLRSFPFNKIKIDQSFIRDLDTNKESQVIVGAIIGLARSLGMITVAEGVETLQHLSLVRAQGCPKVQGYLFSRPRPASEIPDLIQTLLVPGPSTENNAATTDPDKSPSHISDRAIETARGNVIAESALTA